jgi:hypothetical protein
MAQASQPRVARQGLAAAGPGQPCAPARRQAQNKLEFLRPKKFIDKAYSRGNWAVFIQKWPFL